MIDLGMIIYLMILFLAGIYLTFMSMRYMVEFNKVNVFIPFFILSMGFFGFVSFIVGNRIERIFFDVFVLFAFIALTIVLYLEGKK